MKDPSSFAVPTSNLHIRSIASPLPVSEIFGRSLRNVIYSLVIGSGGKIFCVSARERYESVDVSLILKSSVVTMIGANSVFSFLTSTSNLSHGMLRSVT